METTITRRRLIGAGTLATLAAGLRGTLPAAAVVATPIPDIGYAEALQFEVETMRDDDTAEAYLESIAHLVEISTPA